MVSMICVEVKRGCTTYYTGVQLQFQGLHEGGRYRAFVQRGTCLKPGAFIAKVALSSNAERPHDGLLGFTSLDLGIHHFLKDGYLITLQGRDGRRVACGDIRSDRFF